MMAQLAQQDPLAMLGLMGQRALLVRREILADQQDLQEQTPR